MKIRLSATFLYVFSCLWIVTGTQAQILFFADFEADSKEAVPDNAVNDPANWKPANPKTQYKIGVFPALQSDALQQLGDGCDSSGETALPVDINFTDGIIQMIIGWGDNDGVGVILRSGQDGKSGYLVSFQDNETPSVIIALWDECVKAMPACLQDTGCENAGNVLAMEPHGLAVDESGNTAYLCRVEVKGDTIRAWEVPLDDVADPMAEDLGIPPTAEAQDNAYASGGVFIFHETCPHWLDDLLITGPGFFSVDPKGKLTTYWGSLKSL